MKKNKALRLASVLMMACLLTTCVISGTFAKYTTTQSGSDSARVAKWGVTVAVAGTTFQDAYDTDDTTVTGIAESVVTAGAEGDAVLAPGTKGDMTSIEISGTPEVAVDVKYVATLKLENWEVDGAEYCPIVFTVDGEEIKCTGTIADFITAVEEAIEDNSKQYAANTDLATNIPTVSWSWAFEGDDAKDTALGNAGRATISLSITVTVTQID